MSVLLNQQLMLVNQQDSFNISMRQFRYHLNISIKHADNPIASDKPYEVYLVEVVTVQFRPILDLVIRIKPFYGHIKLLVKLQRRFMLFCRVVMQAIMRVHELCRMLPQVFKILVLLREQCLLNLLIESLNNTIAPRLPNRDKYGSSVKCVYACRGGSIILGSRTRHI